MRGLEVDEVRLAVLMVNDRGVQAAARRAGDRDVVAVPIPA